MGNDIVRECPLPKRIPLPDKNQLKIMKSWGININSDSGEEDYVLYSLPDGWQMVDKRSRYDLPCSYIVDENSMKRCGISGSWKGSHDNELNLMIYSFPFEPLEDKLLDNSKKEEYNKLLMNLQIADSFTTGCGERGKFYIENAYNELEEFVINNNNFHLPPKPICFNDGSGGALSGLLKREYCF